MVAYKYHIFHFQHLSDPVLWYTLGVSHTGLETGI